MDAKESALYDQYFDIEYELYMKLHTLIDASWDSNTLKLQIQKLLIEYDKIRCELDSYGEEKPQ